MKTKLTILITLVIAFLMLFMYIKKPDLGNTINVQAASSMENVLSELEEEFEAKNDIEVEISYAGSGTLATQIQEGAPADIFISASVATFDNLKNTTQFVEEAILASNKLVLVKNINNNIRSLSEADTIAIGTPETVPAGSYALEAIDKMGLTNRVADKLVMTKDVNEVITYVQTLDADSGIVYNTDALAADDIEVVYEFDQDDYSQIVYPIALLTENKNAKVFYDFLLSDETLSIFTKYGFIKYE